METEQIVKPMKKITGMLDILICLLLFISALYKGGFYKEDSLFVSMVICMLGLVCLSVKIVLNIRDNRKLTKSRLETIVDIGVMLMPVAYFLPVLLGKAASRESAIFETIRYTNFAIIYFIVRTTSNKKIYLTSIVVIGIVLALFGIDEITYREVGKLLEPLTITYVSNSNGKISSTLQYANITALFMLIACIIVQSKLAKNLPKLQKETTIRFKLLVIAELFSLILLQSAVVLTTSRMNTLLMILITIIYSGYCVKLKKKKSALMLILMLLAAFALVTSVDAYLLTQNNFMICFTYMITLILIAIGVILSAKFRVVSHYDANKLKQKPKSLIILSVISLIVITIILTTPASLRVNDKTKEGSTVIRNIYTNLEQEMNLDIVLDFNRNNSFVLDIYEVDAEFNKKILVSITEKGIEDNVVSRTLNLDNTTESLMLEFTAINSDISIESFKINGKKITLSYKFIPDTIVFRLKDTLIKDSNNALRFTYYIDAIKLFNKSKLVGIGGEGFKARYQEVQTENYISSEVHSAPLQILVESGIIGFVTFTIICVSASIILFKLCRNKNEEAMLYALVFIVFVATAIFDLVFSFGIMINIFAVILGLIIGEYKNSNIDSKDRYELDNKSTLGMLKIATLSVSLMAVFFVTIYSLNIYRASMIVVPGSVEELENSYNRVGLLETKVALDKYNVSYLNSLLTQYDKHIDLLNNTYLNTQDEDERFLLKTEINNYIVRQKEIADNIVEYEYYNKYAIDTVARCYFKHYISYADIFDINFKNDDIAYVFYVGYGIKLTDRITEIGRVNKLAYNMAYNIYNEYLPVIETQNKMLKSDMLEQAIEDMKQKQQQLKESVN